METERYEWEGYEYGIEQRERDFFLSESEGEE